MPITHKFSPKLDLAKYQTWIVDTDFNSRYFQLNQVPEVLTAGKNAFLINGSPELAAQTEVLIELTDVNGDTIFTTPIKNYVEGLARVVSIEVYEDTPPGLATLTILGHLTRDENGNTPPPAFDNKYNVKWQRRIMVSPQLGNSTTVRLIHYPTSSVTEVLNPFRQASHSIQYLTGSAGLTLNGASLYNVVMTGDPTFHPYIIGLSSSSFTRDFEGGTLQTTVNGVAVTSSIVQVLNATTAVISPGIVSGTIYQPFTATNFTIAYTGSTTYAVTEYTRSYADFTMTRLSTFTGDVYRVKVYAASIDSPSEFEPITDAPRLTSPEMMVTSSYMLGQQKLRIGYFTDDSIPSQYWVIGTFSVDSADYDPS
jgi:hypothetical protein